MAHPTQHLAAVPRIVVGDRPIRGGGFVASGPKYLFTLIHEIGQAVDHRLRIVPSFVARTHHGADWTAYPAIVYRGRNVFGPEHPEAGTPRYGEHFAEGYAHMLTRPAALTAPQRALIRRLAGI